jgi:hypothetical protein
VSPLIFIRRLYFYFRDVGNILPSFEGGRYRNPMRLKRRRRRRRRGRQAILPPSSPPKKPAQVKLSRGIWSRSSVMILSALPINESRIPHLQADGGTRICLPPCREFASAPERVSQRSRRHLKPSGLPRLGRGRASYVCFSVPSLSAILIFRATILAQILLPACLPPCPNRARGLRCRAPRKGLNFSLNSKI